MRSTPLYSAGPITIMTLGLIMGFSFHSSTASIQPGSGQPNQSTQGKVQTGFAKGLESWDIFELVQPATIDRSDSLNSLLRNARPSSGPDQQKLG